MIIGIRSKFLDGENDIKEEFLVPGLSLKPIE